MPRIMISFCVAFGLLISQTATAQFSSSSQSDRAPKIGTSAQNAGKSAIVTVSPARINIRAGSTRRFFVSSENTDSKFVWLVNGIEGGNASVGKINSDGTFLAPKTLPSNNQIEIEAVSVSNRGVSGKASVTLLNPTPSITSLDPAALTYGKQSVTLHGSGFIVSSQVKMGEQSLQTKFVSSEELTVTATLAPLPGGRVAFTVMNPDPGGDTSLPAVTTVGPANPRVSYLAAARFLEQASWGPSAESIAHLQDIGIDAWLDEQFAASPTLYKTSTSSADNLTDQQSEFFVHATTGADQLRQRVAFALGQIFVVSGLKTGQPRQMVPYQNMLLQDAFGSYANLLRDVTLSPTMGVYLDMVNDDKGDPKLDTSPNENYARELMQLFSIGTVGLRPDGTETGQVTYNQATITDTARALTGWTFPGKVISKGHNPENFDGPMIAVEANHDEGKKTIVGGEVLPAGRSADEDLKAVLHALSAHPNAAPFISLRLIQHLVTSDPSPAYLDRVSHSFIASDGNLKTVVREILMDPEARKGDDPGAPGSSRTGHWREPVFAVVAMMRNLDAKVRPDNRLDRFPTDLGQRIFYPESVFNDFSPLYRTSSGLLAPEFELLSSGTALMRANVVRNLVEKGLNGDAQFDLSSYTALAGSPVDLVSAVDHAFLFGRLPNELREKIVAAISTTHDYNLRVRHSIYLVASSALYQVEH